MELLKKRTTKRKNPDPILVIPIVVIIAGLAWKAFAKKKATQVAAKKPLQPTDDPDQPVIDPENPPPKPPVKATGKYIGTGWTNWPHKNRYPTIAAIGTALGVMGYPGWLGWDPLSKGPMDQVKGFQNDMNTVRGWLKDTGYAPLPPLLGIDGKIGKNTVNAMAYAEDLAVEVNESWPGIVQTAYDAALVIENGNDIEPGEVPEPGGGTPVEPGLPPYVGFGWTDWPHKGTFPDVESLGIALASIGYPSWGGWGPLSEPGIKTAKQFQRDSNAVRKWIKAKGAVGAPKPPYLGIDGVLGANTIKALFFAKAIQAGAEGGWINVVQTAKNEMAAA